MGQEQERNLKYSLANDWVNPGGLWFWAMGKIAKRQGFERNMRLGIHSDNFFLQRLTFI